MKLDKKYYPMLAMLGGIVLLIIILMVVFLFMNSGKKTYQYVENQMMKAAQQYYSKKPSELPKKIGEETKINTSTLINENYMKEFSEYNENYVCSGEVAVLKTAKAYNYVPLLDCGESYKTKFLVDVLLEEVVTKENGLYAFDEAAKPSGKILSLDEEGNDLSKNPLLGGYVYRGKEVNNFILIDKIKYRISKIDKNNDLQITSFSNLLTNNYFDKSYNSDRGYNYGYNDYQRSEVRQKLIKHFNGFDDKSLTKQLAVPKDICVGGRTIDDKGSDGTLECSKVISGEYISLLPMFDLMNASLDEKCSTTLSPECSNYNYLIDNKIRAFTLTPNLTDSSQVYHHSGIIKVSRASINSSISYTIFISKYAVYVSGTGSEEDPYIIK